MLRTVGWERRSGASARRRGREAARGRGAQAGWRRKASPSTSPSTAPTGSGWRASTPYDAIVLDIMLPGMNGYKVCATLREEGNWTPILMLTAKDGEWDEVEALDTGADDFLTKPFSLRGARRPAARAAPPRRARTPDGARGRRPRGSTRPRKRCWRGDVEVDLTAREFALLEFLMRRTRRGRVEARDPRPRVGLRLRGRPEHRRGLRASPPQQARPPVRAQRDRDRAAGRATGSTPTVADTACLARRADGPYPAPSASA